MRRLWVCGGMVLHTLPGSNSVNPITSWQLFTKVTLPFIQPVLYVPIVLTPELDGLTVRMPPEHRDMQGR